MTACAGNYATDQYVLAFGTVVLGEHIHSYTPTPKLIEPPRVRANFWSANALIDGGYPAVVWEHQFLLYFAAEDRVTFANTYFHQATHLSTVGTLTIYTATDSLPVFCLGLCTPESEGLQEPNELLIHAGGLLSFSFLGNTAPTTITVSVTP